MRIIIALLLLALPVLAQPPVTLRYRDVVPLALERNLTLQSVAKDVDQAQDRLHAAEGALLPRIGLFTTYQTQDANLAGATTVGGFQNFATQQLVNSFSVQIPVYTGGLLEAGVARTEALTEASRQTLSRTRQRLAFAAKQGLLQALVARENHEVAQANLLETRENLRYAQQRYKGGVATRFDVMQAEVAVASAEQQEVITLKTWEGAQAALATVLNLPVTTRFELPDSLQAVTEPLPGTDLKALTVLALDQRPELAELRAQLEAARAAEDAAAAGLKPNLALALNYNLAGNPAITGQQGGWQILAQLQIPLFDGGVTPARVEEQEHRQQQIGIDSERQALQITLEVKQSLLDLESATSRLAAARAGVASGQEAVRLARVRFEAGVGTSLELITAQANLATAEYSLAQALYAQTVALGGVNLAVGASP
jgi:outer membrane protein TolC